MKIVKMLSRSLAFFAFMGVVLSAKAATVYQVGDATTDCAGAAHGLWTNQDYTGSSCANYFSIDGTLTIDGETEAVLVATATNPDGVVASINLVFTEWVDDFNYKVENGAATSENVDFFTNVLGTITIGSDTFDVDGFAGGFAFQFGLGANAKDADVFGASSWIQTCTDGIDGACMQSHHWDLNLNLTPVPVPAAAWLFGSALMSVAGLGRYRQKHIRK